MSSLNKLFKKPTPREQLRSSQRDVGRNVRDLERELASLKREEQKLVKEIKDAAAKNNIAGAKILAKNLVRVRAQQTKLMQAMAGLRGVNASMASAVATGTVGQAMGNASKAMEAVGTSYDVKQIQQTAVNFARENEKMEMAGEMMEGALESALDGDDVEEETDAVWNQVLDEIGISMTSQLKAAPRQRVASQQAQQQQQQHESEEDEILARLAALK